MVQAKAGRYHVNTWKIWIDQLKKEFRTWEKLMNHFGDGFDFVREFVHFRFANLERKCLPSLLLECNKTVLVIQSNEAKAYARLLTAARGNGGKEVYCQHYLLVKISGLLTPFFLIRLARIKESGIMEWWSNITEYASFVQFHRSMSGNTTINENHPAGASMSGNIIVIFSLLICGLLSAIFGFMLEAILTKILYFIYVISVEYLVKLIYPYQP